MVGGFSIVLLAAVDLKLLHLKGSLLNEKQSKAKKQVKEKKRNKALSDSGILL